MLRSSLIIRKFYSDFEIGNKKRELVLNMFYKNR